MKKLSLITALLLAGCGSDNSTAPPADQGPPTPAIDAFVTAVGAVMTTSDQAEPAQVDTQAATTPDNRDPSSL